MTFDKVLNVYDICYRYDSYAGDSSDDSDAGDSDDSGKKKKKEKRETKVCCGCLEGKETCCFLNAFIWIRLKTHL